jgi:hypothetical protein
MTLIARTTNFRAPTLLADLLISDKVVHSPFISPAGGKDFSAYLKGNSWQPVGLAQKLYILNKHVCLALAGNVGQMARLLDDLAIFCGIPGVTAIQVRDYIAGLDFDQLDKAAFFLVLLEHGEDGYTTANEYSHGEFGIGENALFDQTQAGGSGTEDFMQFTGEKIDFQSRFADEDPRQAIVKNGSLIARLLARERYTVGPLLRGWGGGYEFVYHDGAEFRKLENIAYLLQHGIFDSEGEVAIEPPAQLLYYRYYGERLVIQTVELQEMQVNHDEKYSTVIATRTKATVRPVETLKKGVDLPFEAYQLQSFVTNQVALGFAIRTPTSPLFDPSLYSNTLALEVAFDAISGSLQVRYDRGLSDFIREKFKAAFDFYKK